MNGPKLSQGPEYLQPPFVKVDIGTIIRKVIDEDALLFKDHLNSGTGQGDIRRVIHVPGKCSVRIGDMNRIGIFFNALAVDVDIFYGIEMLLLSYALKRIEYRCHGFRKLTHPAFEEVEFVHV